MPKVSQRKLEEKTKRKIQNDFWKALEKLGNAKDIELFLRQTLSPTEIIMLSKRLAIQKELLKERPYAEIGRKLKVTEGTIAKMSANFQKGGPRFQNLIARLSC